MNINSQTNGDHEVHKITCNRLPNPENRLYLGSFSSGHDALIEARKFDSEADGCPDCSPECHKI